MLRIASILHLRLPDDCQPRVVQVRAIKSCLSRFSADLFSFMIESNFINKSTYVDIWTMFLSIIRLHLRHRETWNFIRTHFLRHVIDKKSFVKASLTSPNFRSFVAVAVARST